MLAPLGLLKAGRAAGVDSAQLGGKPQEESASSEARSTLHDAAILSCFGL